MGSDPEQKNTLPETNRAPESLEVENEFPFGKAYFQVRTLSFREGTPKKLTNPTPLTSKAAKEQQVGMLRQKTGFHRIMTLKHLELVRE